MIMENKQTFPDFEKVANSMELMLEKDVPIMDYYDSNYYKDGFVKGAKYGYSLTQTKLIEEIEFQCEILKEVIDQLDRIQAAARSIRNPELVSHAVGVELPYKIDNLKEIHRKLKDISK